MDYYLPIKLLHILSAVVVTGTGAGIAFFMLMASRSNNVQAIAVVTRHVVLADWLFTLPAVVTQFITGVILMNILGYSFQSTWFLTVISLFIFIGVCWLPVVYLQYRLKHYAELAIESNELDLQFFKIMRYWIALGIPAFSAILVIFWLMVFKPLPLG